VGQDASSVIEVEIISVEKKKKSESPKTDTAIAIPASSDPIEGRIEKLRIMAAEVNLLINHTAKETAERGIEIGTVLNELKPLVKKPGVLWEVWAEENLPFIGRRNREKFMLLAKRKDCHRYTVLGADRLEMLSSATKDLEGEDPIGSLLTKYNIAFDETSDINLAEFKTLVDSAINNEKLVKYGIQADLGLIKDLTREGVAFDKSFIKKVTEIKESEGNPEIYLKALSIKGGQGEIESGIEERIKDFNTLANRLIRVVDYILKNPDEVSKIDRDSFLTLFHKLMELQTTGNITEQDEHA
jgi:hypothetical protein